MSGCGGRCSPCRSSRGRSRKSHTVSVSRWHCIRFFEDIHIEFHQSSSKTPLKDALNNINPAALVDLSWETKYYPVHGLGTSSLGGYKHGSMRGLNDQQFCVGLYSRLFHLPSSLCLGRLNRYWCVVIHLIGCNTPRHCLLNCKSATYAC